MPGADTGDRSPTSLLRELLTEARALGFLGPGPLEPQIEHAEGFAAIAQDLWGRSSSTSLVDLGSGGGLPGLVVAIEWPQARVALMEANGRRAGFLRRAVERLDIGDRVTVLEERAEVCGRDAALRSTFDGVLARSFGRPAVVAECAAPLLKLEGWLIVSEPPRAEDEAAPATRWPAEPLHQFGLEPVEVVHRTFEYRTLRLVTPCPDRFPRRNGVPTKKPLF